jgi:hypothetical protein
LNLIQAHARIFFVQAEHLVLALFIVVGEDNVFRLRAKQRYQKSNETFRLIEKNSLNEEMCFRKN